MSLQIVSEEDLDTRSRTRLHAREPEPRFRLGARSAIDHGCSGSALRQYGFVSQVARVLGSGRRTARSGARAMVILTIATVAGCSSSHVPSTLPTSTVQSFASSTVAERGAVTTTIAYPVVPAGATSSTSTKSSTAGGAVTVMDTDNGRMVTLRRGQVLTVVLNSTYWQFGGSSDPAVLSPRGPTRVSPEPGCVPGGGCGTATQSFLAVSIGVATVSASRTSCGEAEGCLPSTGTWQVGVRVQ